MGFKMDWKVVIPYGNDKKFNTLTKAVSYARTRGEGTKIIEYYNNNYQFVRYIKKDNKLRKIN